VRGRCAIDASVPDPTGGLIITTVAELGEFALVDRFVSGLVANAQTIIGAGDDAAVVRAADGRIVATTDMLVEGVHFRRDWSSAEDVGHKAAAKNLSDVVAIGARPTALLVALGVPGDLVVDWTDGLLVGLRQECAAVDVAIVGGDVVRSDKIVLGVTALGELDLHSPVLLSGARPGDRVAYAGRLGWAAAGQAVLARGFRSPVQVVAAHRRPEPPYGAGPQAARAGATAMTDVSDGLVADLARIAVRSGVRIDITGSALTVPTKLAEVGAALNVDPRQWVLTGGDDYALVATFPPDVDPGEEWHQIGVVSQGEGVRVDGRRWSQGGHEHFR
jgi:thiamine-monophosphate kinase